MSTSNSFYQSQKMVKDIFFNNYDFFIDVISKNYELNEVLIEKYKDKWNWKIIQGNKEIPWSEDLIEKYVDKFDKFDWETLSLNNKIPWSEKLLDNYKDKWYWGGLSNNKKWSEDIIEKFKNYWDWNILCHNKKIPWTEKLLDNYLNEYISKEFWCLSTLSQKTSLPWSEHFIEKYKDYFIFGMNGICENEAIPWSEDLIEKYYYELDFGQLSLNKAIPWSEKLINEYLDDWEWGYDGLSMNYAIPWSESLIEMYHDKFNEYGWDGLSSNEELPWSEKFFKKYLDKWDWDSLSENEGLPWNEDFLHKYSDKWNWESLSRNKKLPCNEELLDKYSDKYDWEMLSSNKGLPWCEELLDKYSDKWDWHLLSSNEGLPWSEALIEKYKDKWSWSWFNKTMPLSVKFINKFINKFHRYDLLFDNNVWVALEFYISNNLIEEVFQHHNGNSVNSTISGKKLLFFDTETTGFPKNWSAPVSDVDNWSRLVQLAWILCDEQGNILESRNATIKPDNFVIPRDASAIHGITTERAYIEGEDLKSVLDEFENKLESVELLIAHNMSFDEKIIGAEFYRLYNENPLDKINKFCTMINTTDLLEIESNYGNKYPKLEELYYFLFKKEMIDAHNAEADVKATVKCYFELINKGLIKN